MKINFGSSVTNCSIIFNTTGNYIIKPNKTYYSNEINVSGSNWNGSLAFPPNVENMCCRSANNMNSEITFPDSCTTLRNSMQGMYRFNRPVKLPSNLINITNFMSSGMNYFNQYIEIPNTVTNINRMFDSCDSFNQNIKLPNTGNLISCSALYINCRKLNINVTNSTIPQSVESIGWMFYEDKNIHVQDNFSLHNNITNMSNAFYNVPSLFNNVTLPSNVINISGCFSGSLLHEVVNIPDSVVDASNFYQSTHISRFNYDNKQLPTNLLPMSGNLIKISGLFGSSQSNSNFNQQIQIPNSVTHIDRLFERCDEYNQPVNIPNSVINIEYMFKGCANFNQPVNIPNNVINASGLFGNCDKFNQPVNISNNTRYMGGMFLHCRNFNQPIIIPNNNDLQLSSMFSGCSKFNQPVNISNNANTSYMFNHCTNFNQPVTFLGDTIYSGDSMFDSCVNFNQNIILPSIAYANNMFRNCNKLSDVTLSHNIIFAYDMFRANNYQSLNIHVINDNIANNYMAKSIIQGNIQPEWSVIDNGYYNALYNIYIYTNTVLPD